MVQSRSVLLIRCGIMALWLLLPVTLPLTTISGAWIIYTMAVEHQHVCPIYNWVYNASCEEPLVKQSKQFLCCTLDDVPLISKCGVLPPESCWFSLLCSTGSFMLMLIGLLRYAQVMEQQKQDSVLNLIGLCSGWLCAAGLGMVGNFQTILTYRLVKTHTHCRTAHIRLTLSLLALITLVLCGVFFSQDSFTLQHSAAVCEWLFMMAVLLFYGTFVMEFHMVSSHTLVVLIQRGERQGVPQNKQERA
ncbi:transmembrane protein 150A-like isoform X2 [Hemibagrus wyckioides]|uniref:transmembrane protein 150A-like isoform X2 n=1 Tax=Hemibagrus wyckioides TaxID=337641 RepID=UPI00266D1F2D|nr:transmembrane protein 150A-like isoform X2 [Hemibagrus wyckioides]